VTGVLLNQLENVKTRTEFSEFVLALLKDFRDNQASWENQDLPSFLEAMSAWIEDMDGFYANQGKEIQTDIPWQIFADILFASRVYE